MVPAVNTFSADLLSLHTCLPVSSRVASTSLNPDDIPEQKKPEPTALLQQDNIRHHHKSRLISARSLSKHGLKRTVCRPATGASISSISYWHYTLLKFLKQGTKWVWEVAQGQVSWAICKRHKRVVLSAMSSLVRALSESKTFVNLYYRSSPRDEKNANFNCYIWFWGFWVFIRFWWS